MKPSCNVATLIERLLHRAAHASAQCQRQHDRILQGHVPAAVHVRTGSTAPQTAVGLGARRSGRPFIGAFLEDLETKRGAGIKTRNLRLTAIRSFFRFVSFEEPAHSALIQRVLAIPSKRHDKRQVHFLAPRDRGDPCCA